jgi:hypothetical protein
MKKLIFILVTVLAASFAARADVTINATNFPDANFRSYLLSEYPSGTITTAQLNARDTLYLYNKGISNMKGVEYFTQLTYLMCFSNNLSSIDVSQNTKLKYLNLGYNKLTSISLTANTALERVFLQNNKLVTVSMSNYSSLTTLWVSGNTTLTGLYCWRDALTNVDVTGCTALRQLKIYNNYNLANITGLADCTALTWLDVEDTSFSDLSAVSGMTSLETLLAGNTKITTLETSHSGSLTNLQVAGDKQLKQLNCRSENLSTLKVTGCTALQDLKCFYNANLTAITGLADCTAMTYLDCEDCAITELPGVDNMNNLQALYVRNNQLTGSFYICQKPYLEYLRVQGNTGLTQLTCKNNALITLDVTACTGLEEIDCQSNPDLESIDGLTDCTALICFACDYCAISSLDMTFCPGLQVLYCYNNQLTSLNLTGRTQLLFLNCKNNPDLGEITGLSDCAAVTYLECSDCGLTELTVNHMDNLQELWCCTNQLTELYVYEKPNLTALYLTNNPLLEEIDCYKNALQILEVSNCPVLNYIDCEDNQLRSLYLGTCPSLMYLLCNGNLLTELNISNNPELLVLWCNSNELSSLDLSHCSDDFWSLDCRVNHISGTIDVSRFTELRQLAIYGNEISQLILGSNHPNLIDIWCQANEIPSIDVSGCSALQTLYCGGNQLTTLDVSGITSFKTLHCGANQISSLRAIDCPSLNYVNMVCNRVKVSKMGQFIADLPTWPMDNMGDLYVILYDDEEYTEGNVMTVYQVNEAHEKGWNVYYANANSTDWEPYPGSAGLRGDVDDSGSVTIDDVTALIDYLLGSNNNINVGNADVDESGGVTIDDVTALIDMLLGLAPSKLMNPDGERSGSSFRSDLILDKELVLERPRKIRP